MFQPGDVIWFRSSEANKPKYHLCVSLGGHYLFLNSPKTRSYPGDFIVPCTEIPVVPATPSGNSIISCSLVLHETDADLRRLRAQKRGSISHDLLKRLITFVEQTPVLSDEDRDKVLDGLGDWI